MGKFIDLTGLKFNRLTVIKFKGRINKRSYWLCKCDCGNTITVEAYSLKSGHTKSCGCFQKEVFGEIAKKTNTTHGKSKTRLFRIWTGMKSRCFNKNILARLKYGWNINKALTTPIKQSN